jgi:hypothetical protein
MVRKVVTTRAAIRKQFRGGRKANPQTEDRLLKIAHDYLLWQDGHPYWSRARFCQNHGVTRRQLERSLALLRAKAANNAN